MNETWIMSWKQKKTRDMEKHDFAAQEIQGSSFSRKSDGNCLLGYTSD